MTVSKNHWGISMKQALLMFACMAALTISASYASAQALDLLPNHDGSVIGSIDLRGGYELQAFAREEQDAIMWHQRYQQAPSGSFDERYAADQRNQAIQRALSVLNSSYAFQGMVTREIESFAEQMNQKFNQASSGSALERMYNEARRMAYTAFKQSILNDVQNLSYDWRRLHDMALRLDQAFNQAQSGSQKEAAYNEARRMAYQNLPGAVEQELPRYRDFRQLEQLALYFDNLYNQAQSGSLKEGTYRRIEIRVFDEARARADWELRNLPQQSLYNVQAEYDQKFNQARSGSLQESYYRRIRDLARSLMGYRP